MRIGALQAGRTYADVEDRQCVCNCAGGKSHDVFTASDEVLSSSSSLNSHFVFLGSSPSDSSTFAALSSSPLDFAELSSSLDVSNLPSL